MHDTAVSTTCFPGFKHEAAASTVVDVLAPSKLTFLGALSLLMLPPLALPPELLVLLGEIEVVILTVISHIFTVSSLLPTSDINNVIIFLTYEFLLR